MITGYKVEPCPCCGADFARLHLRTAPPYEVRCGRCGAVGPSGESEAAAVSAWNVCREPALLKPGKEKLVTATKIAADMVARVIWYKHPILLDMPDTVERARAKLATALEEPFRKEGATLFKHKFLKDFCVGEYLDVRAILAAHPSLERAHGIIDELCKEAQRGKAAEPTAEAIAREMLDLVVHDSDMLDVGSEKVAHAREKLAAALIEPLCRERAALFTKKFIAGFAIGEDTDVQPILAAHPSLQLAHDLLNEFFEEVQQRKETTMPDTVDYSEECDYESLKKRIKDVLRKYFECDDSGNPSKEFDDRFTAQDAIDEIHEIVGDI